MRNLPLLRRLSLFLCALILCLSGCQTHSLPPIGRWIDTEASQPSVPIKSPTLTLPSLDSIDFSLPILSITTEGQAPILSRIAYTNAELTVINNSYDKADTLTCRIRGRGHSSFKSTEDMNDYASKNSYRIKLDEKASLLPGQDWNLNRDWVLISCKHDASALRNHLIWDLARRMGNIPYVPSYTWVELYFNGDYRGMYLLTEQIEVASDRVDIDDSPSVDPANVGYLLEYDFRGDTELNAREGLTYFYLPDMKTDVEWVIKSEVYTEAETAAIRAHLLSCHEAILSGDRNRIDKLINIPSFVDMFVLQELSKNCDVGSSSFYVQRDAGGRLYLTAPWDFDFGFGTYSTGVSPSGLVTEGDKVPPHPWFAALLNQSWFVEAVQVRLEEISPLLNQTLATLETLEPILAPAADRNHERWGIYGAKYSKYVNDRVSVRVNNYAEHIKRLKEWTEKRFNHMNSALRKIEKNAHS